MPADKDFTFKEVAEHNTKKDLYLVIHDKVYDCSSFVDEHPYVFFSNFKAQSQRIIPHLSTC